MTALPAVPSTSLYLHTAPPPQSGVFAGHEILSGNSLLAAVAPYVWAPVATVIAVVLAAPPLSGAYRMIFKPTYVPSGPLRSAVLPCNVFVVPAATSAVGQGLVSVQ